MAYKTVGTYIHTYTTHNPYKQPCPTLSTPWVLHSPTRTHCEIAPYIQVRRSFSGSLFFCCHSVSRVQLQHHFTSTCPPSHVQRCTHTTAMQLGQPPSLLCTRHHHQTGDPKEWV